MRGTPFYQHTIQGILTFQEVPASGTQIIPFPLMEQALTPQYPARGSPVPQEDAGETRQ